MKIWQIDTSGDPDSVDGVAHVLWPVCERLSAAGHQVTLFVRTPLTREGADRAAAGGFEVVEVLRERLQVRPGPIASRLWRDPPDIVQLHGALIPHYAVVARLCALAGVRWVYTTHGGLAPEIIGVERTRRRRQLYSHLVEPTLLRHAAAIIYCVDSERFDVAELCPVSGIEVVIPPPVEPSLFETPAWTVPQGTPTAVYLGRFDPYQKAIDRMIELCRRTPELRLRLVGEPEPRNRQHVAELAAGAPANITFEPPVRGRAKADLLRSATMYLQFSRFEGFPVSIAEALTVGVPPAIITTLGVARTIEEHDLGLILSADLHRAGHQLLAALAEPDQLMTWSARARAYARRHFTIDAVATKYLELYGALASSSPQQRQSVAAGY
jgi:glycosyltransferase involved in cell wall biosynthesis